MCVSECVCVTLDITAVLDIHPSVLTFRNETVGCACVCV